MRFMPRCFPLFLTITVASLAADADWIPLFNGRDLTGWTKRGGDATYRVEDGAILGLNGPGHNTFLCTNREFGDFELEFEVRLLTPLNSGVQIRSKARQEADDGKSIEVIYGPQIEIERAPGEAGYVYGERIGGWMTPEDQLKAHSHFRNDGWNQYRIVAEGPRIRTWVNGQLVSDLVDERVYENHARGFIGLQVHSARAEPGELKVAWRNLRIRPLRE